MHSRVQKLPRVRGGSYTGPKNRCWWAKNVSSKIPEFFFLSSKFSDDLFLLLVIDRRLQQNKYTRKIASAARRQIIGGGAPINKSHRRRGPQIVGGSARRVSRDRVSPLQVSPGDSISIQILPPEDLFQNRFAPRRLYSKTKTPD